MGRRELVSLIEQIEQLSEYQIEQIRKLAEGFLGVQMQLNDSTPKSCPCCGSTTAHFIKKGFSGRKQRYQCKDCGKKFTCDAGKITAFSHQSEDKWVTFIEDTLSLKTLDQCAEHISVCHTTAFYMRQKLLAFLEEAVQGSMLSGLIEADETYLLESQKGVCVTGRKPRKHGESATKRGLSDEQMCICVAADRDGNVVARCVNRAKPSAENIRMAIGGRIAEKSVFQCDGEKAYNKLIEEKQCIQVVLNSYADYNKVYHLNTVNSLHSRLKDMMKHFNGVSTKYLNRYLAMFAALEQTGRSLFHPNVDAVRTMLAHVNTALPIRSLRKDGLLSI